MQNNINFNLSQLEKIFSDINNIIGFYENTDISNNKTILYLSNGEKLKIRMAKDSIAHLLGINMNYLKGTGIYKNTNSFELLKELVSSPYKLNECRNKGIIDYNHLFSEYTLQKINAFRENIKFNIFDTELVCKYDSTITYTTTTENEKYDYLIIKKIDSKYYILGLVKKNNFYVAMSNQVYDSFEDAKKNIKKYINKQVITFINRITLIDKYDEEFRSFALQIDDKLEKLKGLKKYKKEFGCIIDTTRDFEYSLTETTKHRNNHLDDKDLINEIVYGIRQGQIIDLKEYRNTKLMDIINAFNDYLCKKSNNNSAEISYTKLKNELEELKELIIEENYKNEQLEKENQNLKTNNEILMNENTKYKDINNKIYELVKI